LIRGCNVRAKKQPRTAFCSEAAVRNQLAICNNRPVLR
jgi:hypothetical protein